jgi:hypothetical protein
VRWARSAATLTARPRREIKGGVSLSRHLWAAFAFRTLRLVREVLAALINDLPEISADSQPILSPLSYIAVNYLDYKSSTG